MPRSGVTFSLSFEMILAGRWRGISDEAMDALPVSRQIMILAAHRTAMMLEAVQAHHPIEERRSR